MGFVDVAARLGPRVLVCQSAAPGTELALGIVRDAALGPLLVISAGGVLIEIFSERTVVLPPVTRSQARAIAAGHAVTARGGDGVTRPVNREPHLLLPSA